MSTTTISKPTDVLHETAQLCLALLMEAESGVGSYVTHSQVTKLRSHLLETGVNIPDALMPDGNFCDFVDE